MDSDIYKTLEAIGWELESAQNQAQEQNDQDTARTQSRAFADFAANAVGLAVLGAASIAS